MLRARGTIDRVTDYDDRGAVDPATGKPAGQTTLRVKGITSEPAVEGLPDELRIVAPRDDKKFEAFRQQVGGPVDIILSIPGVDH